MVVFLAKESKSGAQHELNLNSLRTNIHFGTICQAANVIGHEAARQHSSRRLRSGNEQ
jgi:hypothetical protein